MGDLKPERVDELEQLVLSTVGCRICEPCRELRADIQQVFALARNGHLHEQRNQRTEGLIQRIKDLAEGP